jgi:hypothetical protein
VDGVAVAEGAVVPSVRLSGAEREGEGRGALSGEEVPRPGSRWVAARAATATVTTARAAPAAMARLPQGGAACQAAV